MASGLVLKIDGAYAFLHVLHCYILYAVKMCHIEKVIPKTQNKFVAIEI